MGGTIKQIRQRQRTVSGTALPEENH